MDYKELKKGHFASAIVKWRQGLDDNRGFRAELRRCKGPAQVLGTKAFHDSFLPALTTVLKVTDADVLGLTIIAGVLPHAKTIHTDAHFAAIMAKFGGGSPEMRDVRFRKLVSIGDCSLYDGAYADEVAPNVTALYTALIRAIKLNDGHVGLGGLAMAGFHWNDISRMAWTREYFANRNTATN